VLFSFYVLLALVIVIIQHPIHVAAPANDGPLVIIALVATDRAVGIFVDHM